MAHSSASHKWFPLLLSDWLGSWYPVHKITLTSTTCSIPARNLLWKPTTKSFMFMAVNDMDSSVTGFWCVVWSWWWVITFEIEKATLQRKCALDFIAQNKWSYSYLKYKSRCECIKRKWLKPHCTDSLFGILFNLIKRFSNFKT